MRASQEPTCNHFFDELPDEVRASLLHAATDVPLDRGMPLYDTGVKPAYAYFVTDGLASVVVCMQGGATAEVAMTGRDGMVGAFHLLGPQVPTSRCFMQVPGGGLRVPMRVVEQQFRESDEFRQRILAWMQMTFCTSLQTSACGLLHEAQERLARWLLMTSDRTETNDLLLTQEYLSEMLGTQRTTIALVAGELRKKGLIAYSRGKVTILDRPALEAAACECYTIAKQALLQLYPNHTHGR